MVLKQLINFSIISFISVTSFAQSDAAWLKGGVNFANVSYNKDGEVDDANMLTSFHVGFMGDISIGKVLAIQPGILLTGKGSKIQSGKSTDNFYYKATANPLYIEVPINLAIKIPLASSESNFFFGAGPYIAIGVGGKRKIEGRNFAVSYSSKEKIEYSNDDPTTFNNEEGTGLGVMRRFDYGLNGTAGFALKNVLIGLNYGYGLAKLQSGSNNSKDNDNKHRVLSISVGFKL
ncbi:MULTISPECIES: outer membrane beta-barrel protein [Niastella]|uniref:PorT family protein n=1 Tax=Niastella soli TaxID=2821487 RepID=A0ABS3Z474_9BACT|nr:outer membrane beta-barrel protein [Niastella soli]MBO9204939.1 PorT family protein [Niastella soli]